MKKSILISALSFALFISCDKEDATKPATSGTVTFYRSIGGSWNLLVDGQDKGLLSQSPTPPQCDYPTFITLKLSTGIHTYDLKSNDGLAWGNPKSFTVNEGCQVVKAVY